MTATIELRAKELAAAQLDQIRRSTDRLFLWFTVLEYIGAVAVAAILSPYSYVGSNGYLNPHVTMALIIGALISAPMIFAIIMWPGQYKTRTIIAVCQMLMSALLIHVSGGRIETHFHVFGTLAFLAFYRDWRVLVWATLVIAADHLIRGIYMPDSVYGVIAGAEWRFVEHAGWVLFEDVILFAACMRGTKEVQAIAERQAQLEATNEHVESIVKERTEDLRASEFQKTTVFENALDGIVCANANGFITEINPAAERIFHVSRHDVLGATLASIFYPGHSQESVAEGLRRHAANGRSHLVNQNVELAAVNENGEPLPIEVSMMCIPVKGRPLYTAFVRDISERKKLEEKVAHTNKMESIGQLATGVAHEINTPNQYIGDNVRFVEENFTPIVDLIKTYRESLENAKLPKEVLASIKKKEEEADLEFALDQIPPALGQALEGVERVGSIIRAMKEFAHPGVASYSMVDLNRIIESTVMVSRNEWKYFADVALDLEPTLPHIQGNPGELSQVVLNMVVNAAQAIESRFKDEQKGSIVIRTRSNKTHVSVTVQDNGCGIPEEIRNNIFDPFFTTKGIGVGTGQGLSISRSIIDRHSGEISLSSKPDNGTTFTITLPIGPKGRQQCA